MKSRHIVHLLLSILLSIPFLACKHGLTIFDQIEQETELEEPVITGTVNSIVKFNSKLYACDGNIYAKDESAVRGWSEIDGPGGIIIKLAADSSNLYALTENKTLYTSTDAVSWTKVETSSVGTIQTIFWDGASSPTAYLKNTSKSFYKLSNSSSPTSESTIKSTVIVKNNGKTYTASGETVTDDQSGKPVSGLGKVHSLTYSAVDSALYAGTSKGLKKLPVDDSGKLTGDKVDPPGNWGATIKSYEAFAVLATKTNGSDAALYTSTISSGSDYSKINGLWGYYYNRRNNWNRE